MHAKGRSILCTYFLFRSFMVLPVLISVVFYPHEHKNIFPNFLIYFKKWLRALCIRKRMTSPLYLSLVQGEIADCLEPLFEWEAVQGANSCSIHFLMKAIMNSINNKLAAASDICLLRPNPGLNMVLCSK